MKGLLINRLWSAVSTNITWATIGSCYAVADSIPKINVRTTTHTSTCWFSGYHWGIHNPGELISLLTKISLQYNITTIIVDSNLFRLCKLNFGRSQWPRGLSRRSAAARLVRSWVRNPPGARMFVCCECCVLSGRSLCEELITRPEESNRIWCDVVCDLETSWMRRPWPTGGLSRHKNKRYVTMDDE
jgi:hypothetical protein